jgi:hypothetical protein
MRTLAHHVAHIKTKPHHIRRQIAFTLAGGLTVFVAFVWLGGNVAMGNFALGGASFGSVVAEIQEKDQISPGSSLVGAVSAAVTPVHTDPHIEIVDSKKSSTLEERKRATAEPTIIPF